MKTGTCYFPSYGAAMRYYRAYESPCTTQELRQVIDRKLNEGLIHIGKPVLREGQTLSIEDNRYHITSKENVS